jgi:hypothetical protein
MINVNVGWQRRVEFQFLPDIVGTFIQYQGKLSLLGHYQVEKTDKFEYLARDQRFFEVFSSILKTTFNIEV